MKLEFLTGAECNPTGGGTRGDKASTAIPTAQRGGQGGDPEAGPAGRAGGVEGVRGARRESHAVLRLAEAVLRARRGRVREGRQRGAARVGAEGRGAAAAPGAEGPSDREGHRGVREAKKRPWGT